MYNEYSASEGKVLFNIRNFTYGIKIISSDDLSAYLYETDIDTAKEYADRYVELNSELNAAKIEEELKIKREALNNKQARIMLLSDNNNENDKLIELDNKIKENTDRLLLDFINTAIISKQNIQIIKH